MQLTFDGKLDDIAIARLKAAASELRELRAEVKRLNAELSQAKAKLDAVSELVKDQDDRHKREVYSYCAGQLRHAVLAILDGKQ